MGFRVNANGTVDSNPDVTDLTAARRANWFLIVAPDPTGRPFYWVNKSDSTLHPAKRISWSPNRSDAQVMSREDAYATLGAWQELKADPDGVHLEPVF